MPADLRPDDRPSTVTHSRVCQISDFAEDGESGRPVNSEHYATDKRARTVFAGTALRDNQPQDAPVDFSHSDLIKQNTVGQSEGFPVGVPPSYNWYRGWNSGGQMLPPPDFTAVEGWGQVYQEVGAPDYFNPHASVEVANAKTYVHVKQTSEWLLVQDQSKLRLTGGHFVPDFAGNAAIPMKVIPLSGAHTAFDAPPPGYNNHFWYGSRGTYAAGTVDAVYVQMDMRVSDSDLGLVAMVGADWWRDASAPYLNDHSNNPGIGGTNWVRLSTEWKTLGYYSMSTERFQANPPPALLGSAFSHSSPLSSATVAPAPPKFTSSNLDTGVVGNVTTSIILKLTGTAEAGSTIAIFDGAKQIGTAKVNASGAWRFTTPSLSKTDHYFTARATDVAGNTSSASPLLNIKVDTAPVPSPAGDKPLIKGTLDALDEGGERHDLKHNDGNNNARQTLIDKGDHFSAAVGPQPQPDRPTNPGAALSDSLVLLPIFFCAIMTLRRSSSRNRVASRLPAPAATARRSTRR
jgi:hypothetical protein